MESPSVSIGLPGAFGCLAAIGIMMEQEIEVKLLAPTMKHLDRIAGRSDLGGLPLAPVTVRLQEDTYLDSADFHLFRSGYSLRFRHRDGIVKANLKSIPGPRSRKLLRERLEIEEEVPGETSVAELPAAILRVIAKAIEGVDLEPVVRIRTERQLFRLGPEEEPAAMFCVDRAWVIPGAGGDPVHGFLEVEVEDAGGGRDVLSKAGNELMDEHGLRPSALSKFERGLRALGLLETAQGERP
jgi:inorganic triphosphatase YgiF